MCVYHLRKRCKSSGHLCSTAYPSQYSDFYCLSSPHTKHPSTPQKVANPVNLCVKNLMGHLIEDPNDNVSIGITGGESVMGLIPCHHLNRTWTFGTEPGQFTQHEPCT